jgi:DNA-binding transcriptional ArsR family regulator
MPEDEEQQAPASGPPTFDTLGKVEDVRALRAIAHPVRNRILSELYAAGPLRAADVAEVLGIPANQASFHLRQLARYDLVVEAPEAARDGRDRVWKPAIPGGFSLDMDSMAATPGGAAAVAVFRQHAGARAHHLVDSAYARKRTPGSAVMVSDQALRLSESEAKELGAELTDLVLRWAARTQSEPPPDGEERQTYALLEVLQPWPEDLDALAPGGDEDE